MNRSPQHILIAFVITLLLAPLAALHANNELSRTRIATWTESWPDADGQSKPREVKGEIWNDAIQAVLDKANAVHLPKRDQPYYRQNQELDMMKTTSLIPQVPYILLPEAT